MMAPDLSPSPPAVAWLVRDRQGALYAPGDLATLQRWVVERRLLETDQVTLDGRIWRAAASLSDLSPFFAALQSVQPSAPAPASDRSGRAWDAAWDVEGRVDTVQALPRLALPLLGRPAPARLPPAHFSHLPGAMLLFGLGMVTVLGVWQPPGALAAVQRLGLTVPSGLSHRLQAPWGLVQDAARAAQSALVATWTAVPNVAVPLAVPAAVPPPAAAAGRSRRSLARSSPSLTSASASVAARLAAAAARQALPAPSLSPAQQASLPAGASDLELLIWAQGRRAAHDLTAAQLGYTAVLVRNSQQPGALLGLGWCALDGHQAALAQTYFERALIGAPRLAEAHWGLSQAFAQQQDRHASVHHLRRFIAIDPDAPLAAAARQMLEELSN